MFDDLLHEFYAAHTEHIAGQVSRAVDTATGIEREGRFLDSESLRAFFVWLVRTGKRPRAVVERAWLIYHQQAPDDFPLPFPWKGNDA